MQTPETDPAAVDAMLHRATTGMLCAVVLQAGPARAFDFWQGYAKALHDRRRGIGQKLAAKDAQLGGYEPPRFLRAAAGVLGVDVYRLPRVEIEQRLAQAGIKVPFDALALGDAEAAKQLEDGAVAAVNLDEEHAVAGIDVQDGGYLHRDSLGVETFIVKEQQAHTPGPWAWRDRYKLRAETPNPDTSAVHTIFSSDGGECGYLGSNFRQTGAELDADRALIAAAPELLGAALLAAAVLAKGKWLDSSDDPEAVALRALQAAIAKATQVAEAVPA